ncbi:MAG: Jag N-terminal domain-containing protein [Desulfovibrionaceae bacterium]|nr:Jag N-terminal domain-containing protein [Desulfovibrionaceae bacterium]
MDAFKEFQGKDLDTAIEEACSYFNVNRDQLEIEIVCDAKTGIFGIVGTRKAAIRARRVHLEKAAPFVPDMKLGFALAPHKPKVPALRGDNLPVKPEKTPDEPAPVASEQAKAAPKESAQDAKDQASSDVCGEKKQPCADGPAPSAVKQPCPQKEGKKPKESQASAPTESQAPKPAPGNRQKKNAKHSGRKKKGGEAEQKAGERKEGERKDIHRKKAERKPAEPHAKAMQDADIKESEKKEAEHKALDRPKRQRQPRQIAAPKREEGEFHFSGKRVAPFAMDDTQYDFGDMPEEIPEGLPLISKEALSSPEFREKLETILMNIIEPIIGVRAALQFEVYQNSVRVHIDSGEHSGLLIGREGQTLIAIQYLTSRILTHMLGTAVRLQLDAGEYRQRQEDKLNDIAQALAERARQTGRSFSTRPLSSYHRRIIHMCLQNAQDIQTRSIGEGSMKRVIIMCRREKDGGKQETRKDESSESCEKSAETMQDSGKAEAHP